jgi:hypothetical protein
MGTQGNKQSKTKTNTACEKFHEENKWVAERDTRQAAD